MREARIRLVRNEWKSGLREDTEGGDEPGVLNLDTQSPSCPFPLFSPNL